MGHELVGHPEVQGRVDVHEVALALVRNNLHSFSDPLALSNHLCPRGQGDPGILAKHRGLLLPR